MWSISCYETLRFVVSKLTCGVVHLRAREKKRKGTRAGMKKKREEINSKFESQVKKRCQKHREGEGERGRGRETGTEERSQFKEAVFSERQTKAGSWSQQ